MSDNVIDFVQTCKAGRVTYLTKDQQEARYINDCNGLIQELKSLNASLIYNIQEKDKLIELYTVSAIKMQDRIAHLEKELEFWKIDATLN
jgi:hypothetical protein